MCPSSTDHRHLMLIQCVIRGDKDTVRQLLIDGGVDVNGRGPEGRTALLEAFSTGAVHIVIRYSIKTYHLQSNYKITSILKGVVSNYYFKYISLTLLFRGNYFYN